MALATAFSGSRLSQILFRRSSGVPLTSIHAWSCRNVISASIAIPSIATNIPGLISDIWEGILRAVPKKKTSHMKKRHRQLAGKALKDVKAVNQCPGCGRPKKAHTLCPYCVAEIYESWKHRDAEASETAKTSEQTKV
ncbi:hypothetical protein CLAIMM_04217 [Cladophialophora immunda]|nr:hypothetical protein CLAIMM_04217 [Cladophialophora immunda]